MAVPFTGSNCSHKQRGQGINVVQEPAIAVNFKIALTPQWLVEFRIHFGDHTALNIKFTISKNIVKSAKVINLATPVCFVLWFGVRVERSDLCSGFCPVFYPFLPSVISDVLHVLFSV